MGVSPRGDPTFKHTPIIRTLKLLQRSLSALLAAAVLAACAPQLADVALPLTVPGRFSASGAADVPDRWWHVLTITN
jgi:hypothetical protein